MSATSTAGAAAQLSTKEFGERIGIKPATLYVANWRDGHYRGARPIKLRNGGLRWLASDADRILGGGAA